MALQQRLRLSVLFLLALSGCPTDPTPSDAATDRQTDRGCTPTVEMCNGEDDDCDDATDEGAGMMLGCENARCTGGSCVCPPEQMCGGDCVDLTSNAAHCGQCNRACDNGLSCSDRNCCDQNAGKFDLLFVVDNSSTMEQEQAVLARQVPALIRALSSGDADGDGMAEFEAVTDLQVGVVSTDMGNLGNTVPSCNRGDTGDNGVLVTRGNTRVAGCMDEYPKFVNYRGDATALSAQVACKTQLGIDGCGFEQPLEAALKALTPATSATRFHMDSMGHGDGENTGFLREDSLLVVVFVTDEDDCSPIVSDFYNSASATYTTALGLRCYLEQTGLHRTRRYVDGLMALRSSPQNLIVEVIGGVPIDLVTAPSPDLVSILQDPRMAINVDAMAPEGITPACTAMTGSAVPARRLIQTLADLQLQNVPVGLASICQDEYSGLLTPIVERLENANRCP